MKSKHHIGKNIFVFVFVICILLLTGLPAAHADLVSYTTTTPIAPTPTDWTASLSFPKFNSSLGTLTSVELDLSSSFGTTLTITNTGDSSSSGNAKTEVQFTVSDLSGYIAPILQIDRFSTAFNYSLDAGRSVTSGLLTTIGSSNSTYTSSNLLSEFTGNGSILLSASTFTQTVLANTGGNTSASQITNADLTGMVKYTYTTVPLPSALLLFAPGLVGLAAFKRKYFR